MCDKLVYYTSYYLYFNIKVIKDSYILQLIKTVKRSIIVHIFCFTILQMFLAFQFIF